MGKKAEWYARVGKFLDQQQRWETLYQGLGRHVQAVCSSCGWRSPFLQLRTDVIVRHKEPQLGVHEYEALESIWRKHAEVEHGARRVSLIPRCYHCEANASHVVRALGARRLVCATHAHEELQCAIRDQIQMSIEKAGFNA